MARPVPGARLRVGALLEVPGARVDAEDAYQVRAEVRAQQVLARGVGEGGVRVRLVLPGGNSTPSCHCERHLLKSLRA